MNTLDQLAEMAEAIHSATAAVNESAKAKAKPAGKPKKEKADAPKAERPEGSGLIYNEKGIPTALDETYWMETLAQTGDVIYDTLSSSFFQFVDGLWKKSTQPIVGEWVGREITRRCPECPPKLHTRRAHNEIALRLTGHPATVREDAFSNQPHGVILVQNGRLEISRDGTIDFEPGDRGRKEDMKKTRLSMDYCPSACSTKMLAWFNRAFSDRVEDVDAIGNMMGATLWGSNRWKKLVYISGLADLGKSQIPLVIERLAGKSVCCDIQTHRLGEKFEFHRFLGKVFLRAADVDADFMSRTYADALKQLTGFDPLRVEGKNSSEEFELKGDKMICATSNFRPRVKSGVDRSAWETRLIYLVADGTPYADDEKDCYFLESLFSDPVEASGILNFALAGLQRLLTGGWRKSETQVARVAAVMDHGGHVETWAEACIERTAKGMEDPARPGLTVGEAYGSYLDWCEANEVEAWAEQTAREMIKTAIEDIFRRPESRTLKRGGTPQRGWYGLSLRVGFNPQAS